MRPAEITIVVVQRDHFSTTRESLESVYANSRPPFGLVYVDAGSPGPVAQYLAEQARERGFELLRFERYMPPNRARKLGLARASGRFVVFLDNDAMVPPGWLEGLVGCAEQTGAWLVGPLYLEEDDEVREPTVHMAGGSARIAAAGDGRHYVSRHHYPHQKLATAGVSPERRPTELVEYHCVLALRAIFEQGIGIDERLLSLQEHDDLCLAVAEAGGGIHLAPDVVVRYYTPPRFAWSDLPYFWLRWSEAWNWASTERFFDRWKLRKHDRAYRACLRYGRNYRQRLLRPLRRRLERLLGERATAAIFERVVLPTEKRLNRLLVPLFWRDRHEARSVTAPGTRGD